MIDPAKMFPNTHAEPTVQTPHPSGSEHLTEDTDAGRANRMFPNTLQGHTAPAKEPDPVPRRVDESQGLAARMFPATKDKETPEARSEQVESHLLDAPPPAEYVWEVPEDLAHLGLVPDPTAAAEFSKLARGMGLSQAKATQLLHHHLRSIHGSKR